MTVVDLGGRRRFHIVGVGGAAMSAIATILRAMGHDVSGSDSTPSSVLDELTANGVRVTVGHDGANLVCPDVVAASTAIPSDNPEVLAAAELGIAVVSRADVLGALCRERRSLAVTGTHGKTTTTAMLATILRGAGARPSFLVGAPVASLGGAAHWDADPEGFFVVEADESDGTFLELVPLGAVVTNIEPDHLDHHGSFSALKDAFGRFIDGVSGPVVVCIDDPVAAELAGPRDAKTYGTSPDADYRIIEVESDGRQTSFGLVVEGHDQGRFSVAAPGIHNARNAAGALALALTAGDVGLEAARSALASYQGLARRFESKGEVGGIAFVDSYDHLPTEVAAVLAAAREGDWGRIVCVFQPHRYTRTRDLGRDFATSFDDADSVVVTDIYSAGQAPIPGVTGKIVVDAILEARPYKAVAWLPERASVRSWLLAELRPGDLCLTLGAGDLTTLPDEVKAALARGGRGKGP